MNIPILRIMRFAKIPTKLMVLLLGCDECSRSEL